MFLNSYHQFEASKLDDACALYHRQLPENLKWDSDQFEFAWKRHPPSYDTVVIHGRPVKIPRFQQAYDRDYQFSGQTSISIPLPEIFQPLLDWARNSVYSEFNGVLLTCTTVP